MQNFISPVELKIRRAEEKINELSKLISEWGDAKPIKARLEMREGRLGTRLVIENISNIEYLEKFGLITGECIHNLRTALDNLVYALARIVLDPPAKRNSIQFPICETHEEFSKQAKKYLQQLPLDAVILIEKLQPFQRLKPDVEGNPNTDPLVLLRDLSNNDKHRIPIFPTIIPSESINLSSRVEFFSEEDASSNVPPDITVYLGPLAIGTVVIEHKTNKPVHSAAGEFNFEASVVLQLKYGFEGLEKTLRHLHWYTNLVTDQFRYFFR
ncbi:hypothetical protein [Rhizobium sp. AG855]|uniref:hypothetical protein n=1 Tax=Rhizobium sp. AG855 TaxID=2183898 RepID=UPI000FEF18D5|nr:hypothetical protein [Rhizobium sp. AG855]RKE80249.1 hypothetical protein DFO46_3844 [Rhizobium sp. AG855]